MSFEREEKNTFSLLLCTVGDEESFTLSSNHDQTFLSPHSPSFLLSIAGIEGSLMPYSLAALILQATQSKYIRNAITDGEKRLVSS